MHNKKSTAARKCRQTCFSKIQPHHHRVAHPWQDIAISTSFRHLERSCACFHTELRPRLCCWRSSSIVRSHVRLGRPGGRCQSTGRRLMAYSFFFKFGKFNSTKLSLTIKREESSFLDKLGKLTKCKSHYTF